jgi:bifunctional non-homologous end joining protein LigD
VALDEAGRPSFNALQNYGASSKADILCYVFDVMVLTGVDLRREPLSHRIELLEKENPAETKRSGPLFV